MDTYKGKLTEGSALEYVLFITFFPQLILGPIVHYRELQPQFRKAGLFRRNPDNFSLGMCIFIVGLFKQVVSGNADGFLDNFPLHQRAISGVGRQAAANAMVLGVESLQS